MFIQKYIYIYTYTYTYVHICISLCPQSGRICRCIGQWIRTHVDLLSSYDFSYRNICVYLYICIGVGIFMYFCMYITILLPQKPDVYNHTITTETPSAAVEFWRLKSSILEAKQSNFGG